ncbi:hypothetical protein [Actinophytocola sp.]|uniref:hypothetical protein n=1 Tax=Actinophytocola sp. TaxID=1872138 RepID=UPI003899A5AF
MISDRPTMPVLVERHRGFDDGYRMHCDCGGTSYISAVDYHAKSTVDALMPCEHCEGTIHFGPAVAALRDRDDRALDNGQINTLAWYHTSTQPDWPSTNYASERKAALLLAAARVIPADRVDALVERQLSQTLHVGTYEAAIENMLRRMDDQDDGASQFYLHRVALAVDPDRVNEGYRDENHEEAAHLATTELRQSGLDAVRYLNVRESAGSLSLAVLPETITHVQTASLPITTLVPAHSDSLHGLLEQTQGALDGLDAHTPDTSAIPHHQLRLRELRGPDPDEIAAASTAYWSKHHELWEALTAALVEEHLVNVSPVVQEDFTDAMSAWLDAQTPATPRQFADFFAASAVALTRPDAVKALLATYEPRAMPATSGTQ